MNETVFEKLRTAAQVLKLDFSEYSAPMVR